MVKITQIKFGALKQGTKLNIEALSKPQYKIWLSQITQVERSQTRQYDSKQKKKVS